MIAVHPKFINRSDSERYVVLPLHEYVAIKEALDDVEDLRLLEEARREDDGSPSVTLADVMTEFGLSK